MCQLGGIAACAEHWHCLKSTKEMFPFLSTFGESIEGDSPPRAGGRIGLDMEEEITYISGGKWSDCFLWFRTCGFTNPWESQP